jgi:hypothetical protein
LTTDGGLRKLFRKYLPHVHWTTIESRYTQAGIPDLNGCYSGIEIWLECKQTAGWKVNLRPMQVAWISRRISCGGRCFIAVRRKNKKCDELWILDGMFAQALRETSLPKTTKAGWWGGRWHGGPAKWPWQQVAKALAVPAGAPKQGRAAPWAKGHRQRAPARLPRAAKGAPKGHLRHNGKAG